MILNDNVNTKVNVFYLETPNKTVPYTPVAHKWHLYCIVIKKHFAKVLFTSLNEVINVTNYNCVVDWLIMSAKWSWL